VKHAQFCQFETAALLSPPIRTRGAFHNTHRAFHDASRAIDLD
jgi:hypothetical protein